MRLLQVTEYMYFISSEQMIMISLYVGKCKIWSQLAYYAVVTGNHMHSMITLLHHISTLSMTYQVTYQVRPHLFQRILRTREAIGPDGPISP